MSFNSLRDLEIASAIIIDTRGRLLLQQRDNIVGILHPGRVGLFGGHREGDETFLECVVREVQEEISYFVPAERFEYLAEMVGLADSGGSFRSKFYVTRDIPVDALVITEGSLLIVEPEKLISLDQKLTPTARFAIKRLTTEARFLGDRDL